MSLERKHNTLEHRMFRARQAIPSSDDPGTGNGQASPSSPAASQATSSAPSPPASSPTIASTSTQPTSTSPKPQEPSSSSSVAPQTSPTPSTAAAPTTSSTAALLASASSSASSSATSSSSSTLSTVSSTTSSTPSTTSTGPLSTSTSTAFVTGAIAQTSSFNSVKHVSTSATGSTISASSTAAAATGAINTGAIVGGIAGGLAALAAVIFIVMFFLRRRSRRAREERFNAAQFRKSAMIVDDEEFAPVPRPPEMISNRMNIVPSTGSIVGAGMAGTGAYKYQNEEQVFNPYHDETPRAVELGSTGPVAQSGAAQAHQPLQPRQQYTFGQSYQQSSTSAAGVGAGVGVAAAAAVGGAYAMHEYHDAEPNGVYSSQPQVTDVYDPEVYGNYHAYLPDANNEGVQAQGLTAGNRTSVATVADDAYGGI
ncbi:hypothetical protein K435DRAFT_387269 [Dendrothele bispora CBS 962.96]|uniref:REJ domain-containing protein n=1 Tax=Dendrothele bispora (strain CBS 962.96) TaxID=1314807 RepID=A0A4S8L9N0_DENBC|nr:hypothetical protein K435DRAFT_387269 [Dendrothele bispora CBS 962.96]